MAISGLYKDILANVLFPMLEIKDLMNLIVTCKENRDICVNILLLNQDNRNKAAIYSFKINNYAYVKTWLDMWTPSIDNYKDIVRHALQSNNIELIKIAFSYRVVFDNMSINFGSDFIYAFIVIGHMSRDSDALILLLNTFPINKKSQILKPLTDKCVKYYDNRCVEKLMSIVDPIKSICL